MLDESSLTQRLVAEFIGTAILVFIGVGSVPATLILNGNAPFTMADLGMISLAFGTAVVATVVGVFAVMLPVAPATGASINPARTVGPMLVQQFAGGSVKWNQLPVYLIAELLAGVAAAVVYGVLARTPADGVITTAGI